MDFLSVVDLFVVCPCGVGDVDLSEVLLKAYPCGVLLGCPVVPTTPSRKLLTARDWAGAQIPALEELPCLVPRPRPSTSVGTTGPVSIPMLPGWTSARAMVVAVPPDRDGEPGRVFEPVTPARPARVDWRLACHMDTVA